MVGDAPREVEAKFTATPEAHAALLALDVIADFRVTHKQVIVQRDVYFDSLDGMLTIGDATLRIRRTPIETLMTFKGEPEQSTGSDASHFASRLEDEVPIDGAIASALGDDDPLPLQFDAPPLRRARRIVGDARLFPVAVIENERTVMTLTNGLGAVLELAVDRARGVRRSDGRVLDFDEVELESKSAAHTELETVAAELLRQVPGLSPGGVTKLARTLA